MHDEKYFVKTTRCNGILNKLVSRKFCKSNYFATCCNNHSVEKTKNISWNQLFSNNVAFTKFLSKNGETVEISKSTAAAILSQKFREVNGFTKNISQTWIHWWDWRWGWSQNKALSIKTLLLVYNGSSTHSYWRWGWLLLKDYSFGPETRNRKLVKNINTRQ